MTKTQWTIECAPQMSSLVGKAIHSHGGTYSPHPGRDGFADVTGMNSDPAAVCPFVRRQWRQDFVWPGGLALPDFIQRASKGLVDRFGERIGVQGEIQVTTTFRDRSHLGSRLQQRLGVELKSRALAPHESVPQENSLYVLLTPKGLIASAMPLHLSGLPPPQMLSASRPRSSSASDSEPLSKGPTPKRDPKVEPQASRAGDKVRQALVMAERLKILNVTASPSHRLGGQTWLDLGASPGGMSQALQELGARVVAIDRAPLAPLVMKNPDIFFVEADLEKVTPRFLQETTRAFAPPAHSKQRNEVEKKTTSQNFEVHGIACDMNGPPEIAAQAVARLAATLVTGSLVVFTLKLQDLNSWESELARVQEILSSARPHELKTSKIHAPSPLALVGVHHLWSNRDELSLLFRLS